MAKAKPIVSEKSLFAIVHVDEARKIVFEHKKAIMFQARIKNIKGTIELRPDADGGATIKCRVFPFNSIKCKSLEIPCADAEDFEAAFSEAREKTLDKMAEMAKAQRKYKIR